VKATFAQRAQPGAGSPSLRTLQRPVRPVRVTQFPRPWPANHKSSGPLPSTLISGRDLKREAQIFRKAELHSNSAMPSRAENVLMRKTQAFATRFTLPCHACPTAHTHTVHISNFQGSKMIAFKSSKIIVVMILEPSTGTPGGWGF
jgi:hypothetical protein